MTRSKIDGCVKVRKKTPRHGRRWCWLFSAIVFVTVATDARLQGQSDISSDRSAKNSPIAAPFSWTGFYIGGNLGWNWGSYDLNGFSEQVVVLPGFTVPVTVDVPAFSFDDRQLLGGGQLGYNQQFGKFVIGFEGDFQATSLSGSTFAERSFFVLGQIQTLGISRSLRTDWTASTRLRAGVAWERFLFYGTGGAAFADVNVEAFDFLEPVILQTSRDDATLLGWTAGIGAEWAVAKSPISVGLEYRHSDFGGKSFNVATANSPSSVHSTNVDFTDDQVTFRVNLYFNGLFGR
jgi:outer membrane immunogenic protein